MEGELAAAQEARQAAVRQAEEASAAAARPAEAASAAADRQAEEAVSAAPEQTYEADSQQTAGVSSQAALSADNTASAAPVIEAAAAATTSYSHLLQEVAALRQRLHDSSIEVVAGIILRLTKMFL